MDLQLVLIIVSVAFAGSFIQSAAGFGYALISMSVWALFMPMKNAAVIELVSSFFMVLFIAVKMFRHINAKILIPPFLSSILASTAGVKVLSIADSSLLRRIFGIIIILLSGYLIFFSGKIRLKKTIRNGIIAGIVSGILGGLFNVGGPPMVLYYLSVTGDKHEYSATLQAFFVLSGTYILLMHLIMGNTSLPVLSLSLLAFAATIPGIFLGLALFKRFSMPMLKKIVYGFMILIGIYLAISG